MVLERSPHPGSDRAVLAGVLAQAIAGRRLLEHPFYRRWEAGGLRDGELAAYAVAVPRVRGCASRRARPRSSSARGRRSNGGRDDGPRATSTTSWPTPSPISLSSTGSPPRSRRQPAFGPTRRPALPRPPSSGPIGSSSPRDPVAALAGLAAYEVQAPAVARSKADGLRRFYGIEGAGAEFWEVHADIDGDHGEWAVEALVALGADPSTAGAAAGRAADVVVVAARRAGGRVGRFSPARCRRLRRTTPSHPGSHPGCG